MATQNIKTTIIPRKDTYANWTASTAKVLAAGEFGLDTTNNVLKCGDGTRTWANLPELNATTLSDLGITATAAEINKLDGLTATTAELNYVDGVTSAIQTQLNNKAPKSHASSSTTYGVATTSNYGHVKISNDDVATVNSANGLAAGMDHSHSNYVNQNAFSNVKVGSTTVAADTTTDTLELVAGTNVTITPDATNDKITISAKDTVYSHPSTHPASMITGLATVATSGSYNDLSNKPTIPTVNNATLTIQKNGTTIDTFTANSSTNKTINITVPTGAAASKNVDTSISAGSTSANLPTSAAVATFVEGKGYKTTDYNQTIKSGTTTFGANDVVEIVAGTNVTITPDATNKKITISSKDTNTHNTHKINSGTKADGTTSITSASASSGDITLGDSGVTAGEYGPTANQTPAYGSTFNVPDIKVNSKGIVTSVTNRTVKIPASDNTDTKNTAGATNKTGTKLYLVGTTAQSTGVSYSNSNVYIGTDNKLYSNGSEVSTTSHTHSNYVDTSSNETISGIKTFESGIIVPVNGGTAGIGIDGFGGELLYVSSDTPVLVEDSNDAILIGVDQNGKLDLNNVATPTSNGEAANKEYVDTEVAKKANASHTHTKSQITDFPTKLSQFTNDSGFTKNTGTVTSVKITAGTGLSVDNTNAITTSGTRTISLAASGVTANTYGPSADVTGTNGTTIKVPQITVDTYGRVTGVTERTYTSKDTNTTYSAGTGLSLSGSNAFSVSYGTTAGTACQGNDSRLSDARNAKDVYSWAKASSKPSYSWSEIGSKPTTIAGYGITDLKITDGLITIGNKSIRPTSASVLPNDSGDIKTKYRIAKKGDAGRTAGTFWYYKICNFPVNNDGNYASAIISGRIGGWGSSSMSYLNALIWNRDNPGIALIDIAGSATAMSSVWNTCDLVLYVNSDGTATLYAKCYSWFTFDLDLELFQSSGSITYDGTYITTTPSGTLAASASTSTKRLELVNGNLNVNGTSLATQTWVNSQGFSKTDTTYSLATSTTPGLVKIGYTTSGKNYAVQLNDGKMYVNVPWTDSNTHYTTGLYVGATNTKSNAATSNGATYLKLYDDSTKRAEFKITGSGATSVSSDASGNITISSTNTTYSEATTSAAGLMSSSDKTKLNGISAGANKYIHPTGTGSNKVEGLYKFSTDSGSHIKGVTAVTKDDITALGIPAQDTTYSAATTSAAGLMSATDKTKLDGIATGATKVTTDTVSGWGYTKNTGTVTSVKVGSTSYSPSSGVVSLPAYPTSMAWGSITGKPTTFTPSSHNHTSNFVTTMTGYSKPSSTSAIAETDSLNDAIGKLEKALDGKGTSNLTIGTTSTTAAAGNHTHSLVGAKDTTGLIKNGSTVTSTSGLTACPIISGIPYYKDTNTTYTFNGAVSTIKDSNLTVNRALISNSSGKVAVSAITSTELGYLDGVTSNIQTQLNDRCVLDEQNPESGAIMVSSNANSITHSGHSISTSGTFSAATESEVPTKGAIATWAANSYASKNHSHSNYATTGHKHDDLYLSISGGTITSNTSGSSTLTLANNLTGPKLTFSASGGGHNPTVSLQPYSYMSNTPTGSYTIYLPGSNGTLALTSDIPTFKTINGNTITGSGNISISATVPSNINCSTINASNSIDISTGWLKVCSDNNDDAVSNSPFTSIANGGPDIDAYYYAKGIILEDVDATDTKYELAFPNRSGVLSLKGHTHTVSVPVSYGKFTIKSGVTISVNNVVNLNADGLGIGNCSYYRAYFSFGSISASNPVITIDAYYSTNSYSRVTLDKSALEFIVPGFRDACADDSQGNAGDVLLVEKIGDNVLKVGTRLLTRASGQYNRISVSYTDSAGSGYIYPTEVFLSKSAAVTKTTSGSNY